MRINKKAIIQTLKGKTYEETLKNFNDALTNTILEVLRLQTKGGWLYNYFKPIIEKQTGRNINDLL